VAILNVRPALPHRDKTRGFQQSADFAGLEDWD